MKALSGGERNRLLLARLFTRPANVLVLDEPTNDLDIETLELLEAQLVEWPGTLLLVSHDRAFLDNVVTSTLVFEGDGRVQEYVGGYEDWLRQRGNAAPQARKPKRKKEMGGGFPRRVASLRKRRKRSPLPAASTKTTKPTYREQQELKRLPVKIEALEHEQERLNASVAAPDFYRQPAETITETLARLQTLQHELQTAYARWDELDSLAKAS